MTSEELRQILHGDVVSGAKALLGATLVRGPMRARIVETEAYRSSDDPASHAFRGRTPRNGPMFGQPGRAYIYFNYGVHWMLNVTAHGEGDAAAVLIRAAEPLEGLEEFSSRRGRVRDSELLSGPGKLTQAFGITSAEQGIDLLVPNGVLFVEPSVDSVPILSGPRIGIAIGKGHETAWRFVDADRLRWISRPYPAA